MKNYKASLLVGLGACSYGVLATTVKHANEMGIHTSILTVAQFLIGFLFLLVLGEITTRQNKNIQKVDSKDKLQLFLWGISLGTTTIFYYLSLRYIPVSIAIIMLMQSIWMSVLIGGITQKKIPPKNTIIGALIVLGGTLLATNIFDVKQSIDYRGVLLGLGAALSYSTNIFASSRVAVKANNILRSKYMVLGGLTFIVLFWNVETFYHISGQAIFWGAVIALFGAILPPILFNIGVPKIGVGLGNIIASLEIPVSIISAVIVLGEPVKPIQWLGVLTILLAVVIINTPKIKFRK
ncbi:DMT family transporter [Ornithobacterium rhinotracheale]|uniref:EamA family transporter n=1 Tax=Ornithobacterium rhinotracheale TaxID=28251 RepID=UPI00129CD691|nr:DMT family transporter [Ornithobacterium rhinotracheale]MRI63071.1 DMT family transporter [Ornithobacterium rhinotracheale]MRJ11440.1 DMT family transporter [Ornithobacterium rhinotracheale]